MVVLLPKASAHMQLEMRVAAILAGMHLRGIGFDPKVLEGHGEILRQRLLDLQAEAMAALGGEPINLGSNQQVAQALYTRLGLPTPNDHQQGGGGKQLTTKDEVLQQLCQFSPFPALVLEYRALQKTHGTYIDPLLKRARLDLRTNEHRIHCDWHGTRTATGRLSTSSPNIQAIQKYTLRGGESTLEGGESTSGWLEINVRNAFVASAGCVLIAADYSQIELRILAHCSNDEALTQLLCQAGTKGDVFAYLWNQFQGKPFGTAVLKANREKAKRTVYGIIYGQGPQGLASKLNISVDDARGLVDKLYSCFPRVQHFVQSVKTRARKQLQTFVCSGRTRPLPNLRSPDVRLRAEAERQAVNTVFQGSAADLIKVAMIKWSECMRREDPRVRLVAQIHDELMVECPLALAEGVARATKTIMEGVQQLKVPLVVNVQSGQLAIIIFE